jgi:ubiquinone/menaquinone biosynthesis C-methylase UbiE
MNDFDLKARTWDADPAKWERARAVAEAIKTRVPLAPTMNALECGCGTGLLSFALQSHLGKITLADSSDGMLAVLREKIAATGVTNLTPVKFDLAADPLPAEKYQLVYTLLTAHHIADTDKLLRDFHALLTVPGWLCLADLDKEDGSFHGPGFSGHNGFDRNELAAKARGAGFQEVSFATVLRINKEAGGQRKEFPVFLMVARKC